MFIPIFRILALISLLATTRVDLPYSVAKEKGNAQDKLLMRICTEIENVDELDLEQVMQRVHQL